MECSSGGRSGTTQSGRKARRGYTTLAVSTEVRKEGDDGVWDSEHEEIHWSEEQSRRDKRGVPRKPQMAEGRVGARFKTIEQVDGEIARLKRPPRPLKADDFAREYPKLPKDGDNPHRFWKGFVSPCMLKELFGEAYGDGGHQGYTWAGCKDPGVVKRIQYLHPILYQHPASEIPLYLKIHFAEGIALKYEKGKGHVNWCSFGANTNKRQINCYERDAQKLRALRKTIQGEKPVEIRGREWRSIKVEPGVGGTTEVSYPASVDGDRLEEERRTKSRLGEIGECDGTFESGMGSGVCVEGNTNNVRRGGGGGLDTKVC
jgi:hypothetical protein